jgi:hypothetical protein
MDVAAEVGSWGGVETSADPRGGVEFRYDDRAFGRIAADGQAEPVLHPRVHAMLVETGRLPAADEAEAVELFRLAYERARVAQVVRDAQPPR